MRITFYSVLLALLILAPVPFAPQVLANVESPKGALTADDLTAFDRVLERYEVARLALINDTMNSVAEQGQEIEDILEELSADWSPAAAGIEATMAEDVRSLLPELSKAAAALGDASNLDAARDAFYDLSKPLVRWRKAVPGDRPMVAYCSMAKRSWLQPEGEIGNPYYGQSMHRCGETVDG